MELELTRFDSETSAKFSMHTKQSENSLSLKNVVQKKKMSKKRICWIITNLILGTAIIVNLLFSIEYHQNSRPEKHINWTLSLAIDEVK